MGSMVQGKRMEEVLVSGPLSEEWKWRFCRRHGISRLLFKETNYRLLNTIIQKRI